MNPFDDSGSFRMRECGDGLRGVAIRGAGVTLSAQVGTHIVQLSGVIVLARLLAPSDFGLVTVVTTFSIFLSTLVKIGFPEAILQHHQINHRIASNLFWIDLAISFVCALAFAGTGPLLAKLYGDPRITRLVPVMSLSIVLTAAAVIHTALLDRAMRFSANAVNTIVGRLASVIVSVVLAFAGWGYWALAAGVIAQPLAVCVGAWWMCRWMPSLPRRADNTGLLVSFAMHVSGTANIDYWTRNLDNVLVGWRFGPGPLGFYKKAYDLFALPVNQLFSTFPVAVSTLSRLAPNPAQYRRYFLNGLSAMALVGMGAAGAMTLVGKDLVRLILGPAWGVAGGVFTIFAPGIGLLLIYKSTMMIHLSIGTPRRLLRWTILEFVVTGLLFLLALPWGPMGVAAAWSTSFCILIIPAFRYAGRPIGLEVMVVIRRVGGYVLASMLAGSICAIGIRQIHFLLNLKNWSGAFARLVVTTSGFAVLYLCCIVLLYRGWAPLRDFAGVLRDMTRSKKSKSPQIAEKVDQTGDVVGEVAIVALDSRADSV